MSSTDPITTEIIRNAFISIAMDMNAALIRSAFTPVIYEGKDCSVALIDKHGDVLGQSLGLPLFLGNLEICVKIIADKWGWDYFKEGDVFYMNDSYMTGTHLNDSTIIMPIFWRGERVGFAASRAHWLDVGAKDPGNPVDSHEIYQEGMRWGPTRLYEGGVARTDVIELLRLNSRFGDALIGDMNAQIAAGRTGEKRLRALFDRFGKETIEAARDEIFRQTEARERETIAALPDGVYRAEGCLDNNGLDDEAVAVKLELRVEGDSIDVDLAGSSEQTGPVNCGITQTIAATRVAYKLLICPELPPNGGSFRPLQVSAPEGSIFNAVAPAACSWYFSSLGLLIDLVVKALADVIPERAAAAHYGDSMVISLSGKDPRHDDEFYLMLEPTTGGWGAFAEGDGANSLINNVNGGFKDLPIEIFESKYPVMIRDYGVRCDSGGPGRFRGGNGTYREYELLTDSSLSLWFERAKTTAWGLFGGDSALGPNVDVAIPGQPPESYTKVNAKAVAKGTVIKSFTGGGGGYGPAFEREPERVREDVLDGYVSLDAAREAYGVVLTETLDIDMAATQALRSERAG
ncbi:hydantoinase B/oxoprolinase family protein [Exilibacterium tricleocarpae]|uniref:Hydantoinase B/oxoprolinase family protein n=1 Tax=Exilibacterium tricleocarpae TaxID=2591008 RepID=A0A545SQK1_9GAMM|nr:hydantoinase B/oxoprolinase family protein [Exilibacterium tricleocarpae]TQV67255.1 hydantoinase B/oxoprolinase family protein [Exilibacterium tricleocarpae]